MHHGATCKTKNAEYMFKNKLKFLWAVPLLMAFQCDNGIVSVTQSGIGLGLRF